MRSKTRLLSLLTSAMLMSLYAGIVSAGSAPESASSTETPIWAKFECAFESTAEYENPLYDVKRFAVRFRSPSGRMKTVSGFWDGAKTWRARFAPDETGTWTYSSDCSDNQNTGLHAVSGQFEVISNNSPFPLYQHGSIIRPTAGYHLTHADGTPFFWAACTAWNGALKATDAEWNNYLDDRVSNGYTVIQLVTTQWRGASSDSAGETAFEGSGRIRINPAFFARLDKKIDEVNRKGLLAAPVLLWALQQGAGRHLSPGYHLPDSEAILLARYMVARYGGNQVLWLLGGDGLYNKEYEQRWKNIGRGVFGDEHPGAVALHSQGRSWIGREFGSEEWLDVFGYQTGHNASDDTVRWMTSGPVAQDWHKLPPKVLINMEPCYERIGRAGAPLVNSTNVRNASYWSLFSTPVSGITYGAAGIWPWLRKAGEQAENHSPVNDTRPWNECVKLPGSVQVGLLSRFIRTLPWWTLKPAQQLLCDQPGDQAASQFVSVVRSDDRDLILAYLPAPLKIALYNPGKSTYQVTWFDPVSGKNAPGATVGPAGRIELQAPCAEDAVVVLKAVR